MSTTDRVRSSDVTLGDAARAAANRFRIPLPALQMARALSVSTHETAGYLVAIATLPDGRGVRLSCSPERPAHIISFKLT